MILQTFGNFGGRQKIIHERDEAHSARLSTANPGTLLVNSASPSRLPPPPSPRVPKRRAQYRARSHPSTVRVALQTYAWHRRRRAAHLREQSINRVKENLQKCIYFSSCLLTSTLPAAVRSAPPTRALRACEHRACRRASCGQRRSVLLRAQARPRWAALLR